VSTYSGDVGSTLLYQWPVTSGNGDPADTNYVPVLNYTGQTAVIPSESNSSWPPGGPGTGFSGPANNATQGQNIGDGASQGGHSGDPGSNGAFGGPTFTSGNVATGGTLGSLEKWFSSGWSSAKTAWNSVVVNDAPLFSIGNPGPLEDPAHGSLYNALSVASGGSAVPGTPATGSEVTAGISSALGTAEKVLIGAGILVGVIILIAGIHETRGLIAVVK